LVREHPRVADLQVRHVLEVEAIEVSIDGVSRSGVHGVQS
jgi:hypothetical protein